MSMSQEELSERSRQGGGEQKTKWMDSKESNQKREQGHEWSKSTHQGKEKVRVTNDTMEEGGERGRAS